MEKKKEEIIKQESVVFTWPQKDGVEKSFTVPKKLAIAICSIAIFSLGLVVVGGSYYLQGYQERQELENYRAQYGVYTERLQKLITDNEKLERELAQVAALEDAVRKKLAKEGEGVSRGEIDRQSRNLDNAGKGGNEKIDTLSLLEIQDEINTKRLAYKKENLYNMLKELSAIGDGTFAWPLNGGEISSFFGYRADPFGRGGGDYHPGLDIAANYGEPVKAAASGVVEMAAWNGGYGRYVRIDHGNGMQTAYGHMSAIVAQVGQTVRKGDIIGYVGSSGASTGPHVHFEVLKAGEQDNPLIYVMPRG